MLKRWLTRSKTEERSRVFSTWGNRILSVFGANVAGVKVSYDSASSLPAVSACIKAIAETIATMPIEIMEVKDGVGKQMPSHTLFSLLNSEPNEEMSIFDFLLVLQTHIGFHGQAFAYIERDNMNKPIGLWPLMPTQTEILRTDNGMLFYRTYTNEGSLDILPLDILHIKGTTVNGINGISPIQQHRRSLGLTLAADELGTQFFERGNVTRGVIEMKKSLKDDALDRLKKNWAESYSGVGNAFGTPILEEGMEFKPISLAPNDAQFLETRKYQVEEICRIYRVPPHMVGHLEKATFSNITDQTLSFVKYTIQPWLRNWETELTRKLLTEKEKGNVRIKFNMDELLRADPKTRGEYYRMGIESSWLAPNEVRQKEGYGPIEGFEKPLLPLNKVNPEQAYAIVEGKPEEKSAPQQLRGFNKPFANAFERLTAGEDKIIKRLRGADQNPEAIEAALKQLEDLTQRAIGPVVEGMAEALGHDDAAAASVVQALQTQRVCIVRQLLDNKDIESEQRDAAIQFEWTQDQLHKLELTK